MTNQVVCVTGHRPDKLGGYSEESFFKLVRFATYCLKRLEPKLVITGMALGWDQAIAVACRDLKLPYAAYVPFMGQEILWSPDARKRYTTLLEGADVKYICPPGFAAWKMHERNKAMVDDSEAVLALYNGEESGGTFACVRYARSKRRTIYQCWQRWSSGDF